MFWAKAICGKKPASLGFEMISHEGSTAFSSKSIQLLIMFILFLKLIALFIVWISFNF